MKIQIRFKDPDAIFEIIKAKHPLPDDEGDVTPNMEEAREEFGDKYFEYCDYGCIELDTDDMSAKLLPLEDWSIWE